MRTSTTGKARAFKHGTYTLLIFANLQSEQRNCDQTEDQQAVDFVRVCACTCVRVHVCA